MVGEIVHYVSHGTPMRSDGTRAFHPACRAAVVTEVQGDQWATALDKISLCVLNPTGLFFQEGLSSDLSEPYGPGTWHPVHA